MDKGKPRSQPSKQTTKAADFLLTELTNPTVQLTSFIQKPQSFIQLAMKLRSLYWSSNQQPELGSYSLLFKLANDFLSLFGECFLFRYLASRFKSMMGP